MKKMLCIFCIMLLIGTSAFAANFEIENNPDYKTPVKLDGRYFDTSKCVDYNDKSTKDGQNFKSHDVGTGFGLKWITGASGEDGDYAPMMEAISNSTNIGVANLYLFHQAPDFKLKDGDGTLIAEYDLMVNTTTDRLALADCKLWNSDKGDTSRIFLDETGKVRGTDFTYKAGEWFHVRMEVCYDTQLWNVWFDGEKAVDNMPIASRYSWDKDTRFSFFLYQMTEKTEDEPKAGFAIDNFIAYAVGKDISEFVSLSLADSDANFYDTESAPLIPEITLDFDSVIDSSLINEENIVMTNKMGVPVECDYTVSGSGMVIVPKEELDSETDYRIMFSDEIRASYNSYRPLSGRMGFSTGNYRDFVIDYASFDSVKLSTKIVNNTGEKADSGITLAVYNSSNGLKSVSRKNISLEAGENSFENLFELKNEPDETDKVKLFVTYANDFEAVDEEILK